MAELEWQGPIEPGSLRRALRQALRRTSPGWRVVAEEFLAATTPIDLLAIGESGELICIRATEPDAEDEGARQLASAISDLSWLAPRIADLHKLAPQLGLSPLAQPRVELFAPEFAPDVAAAVEHLSRLLGQDRIGLARYRPLRHQGQLTLLLEPVKSELAAWTSPRSGAHTPPPTSTAPPARILVDPPSPSAFRTGLTEADLRSEPQLPD